MSSEDTLWTWCAPRPNFWTATHENPPKRAPRPIFWTARRTLTPAVLAKGEVPVDGEQGRPYKPPETWMKKSIIFCHPGQNGLSVDGTITPPQNRLGTWMECPYYPSRPCWGVFPWTGTVDDGGRTRTIYRVPEMEKHRLSFISGKDLRGFAWKMCLEMKNTADFFISGQVPGKTKTCQWHVMYCYIAICRKTLYTFMWRRNPHIIDY